MAFLGEAVAGLRAVLDASDTEILCCTCLRLVGEPLPGPDRERLTLEETLWPVSPIVRAEIGVNSPASLGESLAGVRGTLAGFGVLCRTGCSVGEPLSEPDCVGRLEVTLWSRAGVRGETGGVSVALLGESLAGVRAALGTPDSEVLCRTCLRPVGEPLPAADRAGSL